MSGAFKVAQALWKVEEMGRVHKITYYREVMMETFVEAESLDEALEKFHCTEYESGSMVRDSEIYDELVSIEETEITQENFLH